MMIDERWGLRGRGDAKLITELGAEVLARCWLCSLNDREDTEGRIENCFQLW